MTRPAPIRLQEVRAILYPPGRVHATVTPLAVDASAEPSAARTCSAPSPLSAEGIPAWARRATRGASTATPLNNKVPLAPHQRPRG